MEPPENGRSMAASERAVGTDFAGPGVEALSCDELRRNSLATFHLSVTCELHEIDFGCSFFYTRRKHITTAARLSSRARSDFRRMFRVVRGRCNIPAAERCFDALNVGAVLLIYPCS